MAQKQHSCVELTARIRATVPYVVVDILTLNERQRFTPNRWQNLLNECDIKTRKCFCLPQKHV